MKQTSLCAFTIYQKRFNQQERKILHLLETYAEERFTRREIAVLLGMETSTVSARVNALLHKNAIHVIGKKSCPYSKNTVEAIQADQYSESVE